MANAMVALANLTLGSAQASVTFASIPATYRDLRLVINAKNSTTPTNILVRFNGDSGGNYSSVYMKGSGSSATSGSDGPSSTANNIGVAYATAGLFDLTTFDLFDYSATDKHKTGLARAGNAYSEGAVARATRWASTAAVTSIVCILDSNNFDTGSTFALYGIVSA